MWFEAPVQAHPLDYYFHPRVRLHSVSRQHAAEPVMAFDPRVICVLDVKNFPVLFDVPKVEKNIIN